MQIAGSLTGPAAVTATFEGKGFVLSGQGDDHRNMANGEFWQYDPLIDDWTKLPSHPGTSRWAPGSFIIDKKMYMLAGRTSAGDLKDVWKFDLDKNLRTQYTSQTSNPVYPNPSKGLVNIHPDVSGCIIYDLSGKNLGRKSVTNGNLNLTNLANGMYVLVYELNNKNYTNKIILQK